MEKNTQDTLEWDCQIAAFIEVDLKSNLHCQSEMFLYKYWK